jgi:hypothetical protein
MTGFSAGSAQIRVGPFLQNATPTSIWVVWETESGKESRVDFGETEALGNTATGDAIISSGSAWIHRVELTGLETDSRFYYRAVTASHESSVLHFRTPALAESEKPFQFVVYSDTQSDHSNPDKHKEIVDNGIIAYALEKYNSNISDGLAFVINAGDLVDNGTIYSQWKNDFFDEAQNLFQHVPLYPVLGNHERDSDFYTKYFQLPVNGSTGFIEHWYYFDYGNVRIIGLDSNTGYRNQTQLDWLDQVLVEAQILSHIDFVFAAFHHPFKSELWLPGELQYSGSIVERLETFTDESGKPSGHFFGHTHGYSRGQSKDSQHLWVNAASGEGNLDYWGEFANRDYPEFQFTSPDWGFVIVEVEAGDDPKVTLRRISRGNEEQAEDNLQTDWISVRVKNNPPDTPAAVFPTIGDPPVAPADLVFQGSPFNDVDGDSLLESELQVTATAGNYSNPILEEWLRVENWYGPPGASGRSNGWYSVNTVAEPDVTKIRPESNFSLTGGAYFWRIRYRDNALAWSDWSTEAGFSTEATNFTENLLLNPGAEQGITGWTIIDPPLEATANGDCGTNFDPAAGSFFFTVGGLCVDEGPYGEAMQRVDVSDFGAAIDQGQGQVIFGGYFRDWTGFDRPDVWLVAQDQNGANLQITSKLTSSIADWVFKQDGLVLPVGTRSVEFHISGTRLAGTDNDSYLDELFLQFDQPTAIRTEESIANSFTLHQNYPNPFNPSTTIVFTTPRDGEVTLTIHNLRGQVVQTLVDGLVTKGSRTVVWDGRNSRGTQVASGVYIYRLRMGERVAAKKLILSK